MNSERKLVLLPVDGSDESMEVAKYVSKAVNLTNTEVVFLSVIDKMPDIFWETGRDATVSEHLEHMKSWDTYKEQKMRDCFQSVSQILGSAGVPTVGLDLQCPEEKKWNRP